MSRIKLILLLTLFVLTVSCNVHTFTFGEGPSEGYSKIIKQNNFVIKNLFYVFLIFYLFFWYLPQGGGFTGIGNFSSLFKSGLTEKFLELFLIIYNYIDINVITLPRVNI